jgi:hypothetical protein
MSIQIMTYFQIISNTFVAKGDIAKLMKASQIIYKFKDNIEIPAIDEQKSRSYVCHIIKIESGLQSTDASVARLAPASVVTRMSLDEVQLYLNVDVLITIKNE